MYCRVGKEDWLWDIRAGEKGGDNPKGEGGEQGARAEGKKSTSAG